MYKTEHEKVIEYFNNLNLNHYIGNHKDSEVIVLTDSGYDNKNIQNAVLKKGWHFIGALKSSRGIRGINTEVKSKSSGWDGIAEFFRKNRRIGWETIRIFTEGPKRKRKEFRVRHTEILLKGVGKIIGCGSFTTTSFENTKKVEKLYKYSKIWPSEIKIISTGGL